MLQQKTESIKLITASHDFVLMRLYAPGLAAATLARTWNSTSRDLRGLRHVYHDADKNKPLRVLFCGSDQFSVRSLAALYDYSKFSGSNVASIDVATKTDKRTGRGLKVISPTPIKTFAQELGLPLHQFDTFTGWHLPTESGQSYVNMVIAVSFGRLVPRRILSACEYGGLNVHPSMLPDLKGSAPIEHAIIYGYRNTGVTIQTLHPSKFDEGQIVLQTPAPGLEIPEPDQITSLQLNEHLSQIGADMLVQCLRDRLYLTPQDQPSGADTGGEIHFAPKLRKEDRCISFVTMDSVQILRLDRALGQLWLSIRGTTDMSLDTRLIFEPGMRIASKEDFFGIEPETLNTIVTGLPFAIVETSRQLEEAPRHLLVRCADGQYLCFPRIRVSGMGSGPSVDMASKARLFQRTEPLNDRHTLRVF